MNPTKLNAIAIVLILIGFILAAFTLALQTFVWMEIRKPKRIEIYYPKNLPIDWERIPGTNYVIENKRDTLRINKSVEINYTYQILTSAERKSLRDSLSNGL